MSQSLTIECLAYGAPIKWKNDNGYHLSCSDHCKLIDLGARAAEEHVIPGNTPEDGTSFVDLPPYKH